MPPLLGKNAKLYRCATLIDGTTNTAQLATWVEVADVRDLDNPDSRTKIDMTTRGSGEIKLYDTGMADLEITFEMLYDQADTDVTTIETAYETNAAIGIARVDSTITVTGANGIAGNFKVASFAKSEPLENVQTVNVTLVPHSFVGRFTKTGS